MHIYVIYAGILAAALPAERAEEPGSFHICFHVSDNDKLPVIFPILM